MLKQDAQNFINSEILRQAKGLVYTVNEIAPNNETDLFNSTGLVIWSGGSDTSIYNDPIVNYAFRALHDALHLETGLGFTHDQEIELGRIQASRFDSDLMRELVYTEVAGQAKYHKETGLFLVDQVSFTLNALKGVL